MFDFATNAWVLTDAFHHEIEARGGSSLLPEPYEPPRPGQWNRPAVEPKVDWRAKAGLVAASLACFGGAAVYHWGPGALGGVMLLLAVREVPKSVAGSETKAMEADQRLIEDPDDLDVCLVAIRIVQNGDLVGTDKGAAWFEDGRLMYSGHRTSFAIGGQDVMPKEDWFRFSPENPHFSLPQESVPLKLRRGTAYVGFSAISDDKRNFRFLRKLYAFRTSPPRSRGDRQWPPLND